MRIESVTAHAFGPLTGEILELAPGLTVVAGVNESAKSSWHAAIYAALCGRPEPPGPDPAADGSPAAAGAAAPPTGRRSVERYRPWDGAPWRLSSVVVLDDGRRLEVCQDLDGGAHNQVVEHAEDGSTTDVTAEILAGGAPDASRWLGLDRAAFAAVALVNQAEHRAVLDAAAGLQRYLRRATETAGGRGSATPALEALDRYLAERLGGDRSGSRAGAPLPLAQERLRLARGARVVARRGHEQYLAALAASGERRGAAGEDAARLDAAERRLRQLEQVAEACGAAERARALADRSRAALAAAETACEEAGRPPAGAGPQVPEQNAGPGGATSGPVCVDPVPGGPVPGVPVPGVPVPAAPADVEDPGADAALLARVDAARAAWDEVPAPIALPGPSAEQLRAQLAELTGGTQEAEAPGERAPGDGVDPRVRSLAQAHREALAAAAEPVPAPRPSPRPVPAPAELRRAADALEAPPVPVVARDVADPELVELRTAVEAARTRQRAAAEAAEAAERDAVAAEERYEQLRATAAAAGGRRRSRAGGRLRALALTILAVGLGLAALYFGLLAALVFSALVIVPVAVSLLAAVFVVVQRMRRPTPRSAADGGPVVEDLVGAIVTVREKRALAGRARAEARTADRHATECRERHVTALRGERPDPVREEAEAWCVRHGLRADPGALRALAERSEDDAAQRAVQRAWHAATVARTGDALRAALRERGILDEGTPVEQFARYEEQAAGNSVRRAELERALAARTAAEESAGEAATVRGDAVARLRTAAGAVGLPTAGDPETLVRALDGWRAARASRGAVALAERPRPAPVHAFPHGTGPAGNGHTGNGHTGNGHTGNGHTGNGHAGNGHGGPPAGDRAEELQAARDAQLELAWRTDLDACDARKRRDDLATAAGVDPARAGDRAFVAALVESARAAAARARDALAEHGPADDPGEDAAATSVAAADEEVDAAEARLRRMEQLRRTTALTRRYLARAQEQTHRDIAPVLAETLRSWLPGVTRGRYVDAIVDPETLAVQVYGPAGRWRPVDRLSAGTADQVYLLLRVALAQHLAATGETCPLLLDGVTAQADGARTTEILDLLLDLGAERQVVLFTQEDAVLRWAHAHLDGDRHRVRELAALA